MKLKNFLFLAQLFFIVVSLQGMAAIGIKQLSRNNLNEETVKGILVCETTRDEIVDLFREPTDDYKKKQGEYDIYTYYGFSSRGGLKKQSLEVMLNKDGIVVDKRFNYKGDGLMIDQCR